MVTAKKPTPAPKAIAPKPGAQKAGAKKAISKVRASSRAVPAQGPLTVAQARTMVQAAQAPQAIKAVLSKLAAPAAGRKRAPGTAPAPAAGKAVGKAMGAAAAAARAVPGPDTTRPPSPATLAIEQRRLKLHNRNEIKRRIRDYKATLALLQQRGVKGLPAAAPTATPPTQAAAAPAKQRRAPVAAAGKAAAPSAAAGPLRVLAEGDSWFDYPALFFGGGLIPRLERRLGVPILCLAQAGDESRHMLGVAQRKLLAQQLRDGAGDGQPWELLLFSGGGNDIVDEPLALWLRVFDPGVPPAQLLHAQRFSTALALVRAAYEDLIALRDAHSPQTHIVLHAYDFAIPFGRGICGKGPWLKPAFDLHGFPQDLVASTAVVKAMLLEFANMLQALQAAPRVTFINAQDTLAPVQASWHNEMHPSRGGFDQIADVFHAKLKLMFPQRVLG